MHPLLDALAREGRFAAAGARALEPGLVDAGSASTDRRSRAVYDAAPFEHVAGPDDVGRFERGMSPLARRVLASAPAEALALEIGSGPGHVTGLLRRRGLRVVALDQSVESLRRLRRRTDAPAVVADCRRLPFADGTFDLVLADGVLHHSARPRDAFREAVRVLAPGGTLFVRMYRAEGRYPAIHRTVGGLLRAANGDPAVRPLVWRLAAPLYGRVADARDRRAGRPAARHDAGVFADYFLTPHATPVRGATLLAWLRGEGLDVLAYEAWGNVHGMLARRRGGGRPA
jgi:SAM-dependent methyltransferase